MSKLLISNIGLLATPEGRSAKAGAAQGDAGALRQLFQLFLECFLHTGDYIADGAARASVL